MNYAKINYHDIANGEGVRVSLFVSGCRHYCKGCFNQQAWDFNYGAPFTIETMQEILNGLQPYYISGLSILGGEPLDNRNISTVMSIIEIVKTVYPQKTIWLYTGGLFQDYRDHEIMKSIDILVDGPFVLQKKDMMLPFRGSGNQRIINVQKSLETGGIVTCTS